MEPLTLVLKAAMEPQCTCSKNLEMYQIFTNHAGTPHIRTNLKLGQNQHHQYKHNKDELKQ